VEAGTVKLVGTDTTRIVEEAQRLLDEPSYYEAMAGVNNPYGDGTASQQILDALFTHDANKQI
jgi:UDP-N-acetylglucosamine 2-epimerase (non-hydrolysing)